MRSASVLVVGALSVGCVGIAPIRKNPPPPPRPVEPTVTLPEAPPPGGLGRVVLDAVGEDARVTRVLESYEPMRSASIEHTQSMAPLRKEQTLCITTPCSVDLRHGSHELVFTSKRNEMHSSVVHLDVPTNGSTTIVRHAIGTEGWVTPKYGAGVFLLVLGVGLTGVGLLVTSCGAFCRPTMQDDGRMSEPQDLLLPGTLVLGSGLLIGGIAAVMMSKSRPVIQRGSTTTWTKE